MHEGDEAQMSTTCRRIWNGTRQLPPSPVPTVTGAGGGSYRRMLRSSFGVGMAEHSHAGIFKVRLTVGHRPLDGRSGPLRRVATVLHRGRMSGSSADSGQFGLETTRTACALYVGLIIGVGPMNADRAPPTS